MGCGQSKNDVGVIDPRHKNSEIHTHGTQSAFTARGARVHPSGSNLLPNYVETGIDASVQTSRPSSRENTEGAAQKQKLLVSASTQTQGTIPCMHVEVQTSRPPSSQSEIKPTSRPPSAQSEAKSTSRPPSAQSEAKSTSIPTSAQSETKSTSRPTSAQSETKSTSRPTSAQIETKSTSRPTSAQSETKSTSRPTSATSESRPNSPKSAQTSTGRGTPDVISLHGSDEHVVSVEAQPLEKTDPKTLYKTVDDHARKAPESLKQSADDLVNYLATPSKDPNMLVRAIFVWITDNIRYDVEGFFGRAPMASCDAESVLIHGRSVCAGYAAVMELLCRKAKIPVKTITGYAKGYSFSTEKSITTSQDTNHAWNAVQLDGKWFLLDSTWGAGHLDANNESKKEFNDHYFLTDPSQFVTAHFPYMDGDMEASMKWQLLENPITLEQFSKAVKYHAYAFQLNVRPISHSDGLIEMEDEAELLFKFFGEEVVFCETLYHKDENWLRPRSQNAFGILANGVYKIKVRPHTTGTFRLQIFGRKASDFATNGPLGGCLFEYVIKCRKTSKQVAEFPQAYSEAQIQKCILYEPLHNKLPAESVVHFHLTSPLLQRIMINQEFLTKSGNVFEGDIKTGPGGSAMGIFGSQISSGMLNGLFQFEVE